MQFLYIKCSFIIIVNHLMLLRHFVFFSGDSQVERLKSQVFILSCTQRRYHLIISFISPLLFFSLLPSSLNLFVHKFFPSKFEATVYNYCAKQVGSVE